MRGRKPTPSHLKVMRGNPGNRPLNEHEPTPPDGIPECPEHLEEVAADEWQRITALLKTMGLLSLADAPALELYCTSYARWRVAKGMVEDEGEVTETPNGCPILNPWASAASRLRNECHKMLVEFGLTPAARSRVIAHAGKGDELDAFLNREKTG